MNLKANSLLVSCLLAFCSTTVLAQESSCEKYADEAIEASQFNHDGATAESLLLAALNNRDGCKAETLLTVTTNLGARYAGQRRYYEAEPLFREALELAKKVKGENHFEIPFYLSNLAVASGGLGKADESESLFKKAIARLEEIWGKDGRPIARVLKGYANLLRSENRIEEADEVDKRAKEIISKQNEHPRTFEVEMKQN
jgi:tetratricopeptide (TPR) repeat protein